MLSAGGWFVIASAPAPRTAAPSRQAVDVEALAGRARLVATPARVPERLLPSSGSVVAQTAASAASGARIEVLCGEDQRAVYKEPQPDPDDGMVHGEMPTPDPDGIVRHMPGEIKPAGVGYTGAMRRIDAALRASADPFDRAMADWLDLDRITPPAARADALVMDALAVDDPRVYGLAYANCHPWLSLAANGSPSPGCARLSATQWAQLDPGNAAPWLWALNDADQRGDAAAQREALRRVAESSRMDVRDQAGAAALARLQLADADLAAQSTATMQALGSASPPPASPLTTRCRDRAGGDADLASTCSRIAELLYEHSDSLRWHAIGGSLHKLATGDASWLDRAHRDRRQVGTVTTTAVDDTPCGAQREFLKKIVRMDSVGELKLAQQARRAASTP